MLEVTHFVGKDLRIGTVCVSARSGQGVTHVLVRTVLVSLSLPLTLLVCHCFVEIHRFLQPLLVYPSPLITSITLQISLAATEIYQHRGSRQHEVIGRV